MKGLKMDLRNSFVLHRDTKDLEDLAALELISRVTNSGFHAISPNQSIVYRLAVGADKKNTKACHEE